MDDVERTRETYRTDAEAYVEKYLSESVAALYGDRFLAALEGERVLDVGCGPGADVETFAAAGYDVTGLDLTAPFVRTAADRVPDAAIARGDMRRLPFEMGSFDGVWSCASFLHVPRENAAATLREFRRVLVEDGVVFVSVKRAPTEPGESVDRHFEYYAPDELLALLDGAGFDPVEVATVDNWVSALAER